MDRTKTSDIYNREYEKARMTFKLNIYAMIEGTIRAALADKEMTFEEQEEQFITVQAILDAAKGLVDCIEDKGTEDDAIT